MQQMVGDRLRGTPAELEGEADASRGRGRDHAGRIADQQHARSRPWADEAARGDAAGAALDDAGARKAEHRLGACEECREADAPSCARRQPHLCHARARCHPGEIAGRQVAVEKAVQEARIGGVEALEFGLDAHQKALVAAEPEVPCHGRARAVGAEDVTRLQIEPGDAKPVSCARRLEPGPIPEASAGALRLAREPAQQARRIGRQEEATGREEINMPEVRRVKPHPVDTPRQLVRQVDLLGCLLDQNTGGGDAGAGVGLRLQHHDVRRSQLPAWGGTTSPEIML